MISHWWIYIQRTIPGIASFFEPLEKAIKEQFIPAICGERVNDIERRIFVFPVKLGGLVTLNPTQISDVEFNASTRITADPTLIVCNQENLDIYLTCEIFLCFEMCMYPGYRL